MSRRRFLSRVQKSSSSSLSSSSPIASTAKAPSTMTTAISTNVAALSSAAKSLSVSATGLTLDQLPVDALRIIFNHLTARSLIQCQTVCHLFGSIVSEDVIWRSKLDPSWQESSVATAFSARDLFQVRRPLEEVTSVVGRADGFGVLSSWFSKPTSPVES